MDVDLPRHTMPRVSAKSSIVLGVSAYYHDSAASLVVDGRVVAAAQEERFTRRKGTAVLPENAIDYCLKTADVSAANIDLVAYYESPFAKMDRLLSSYMLGNPRAGWAFSQAMRTWLPDKLWVENHLRSALGPKVPVVFADHHLSHAASAYYPSPYSDAAILTVDGVGEWTTTMIAKGEDGKVEPLVQVEYPNSLGMFYSAFTLYCGFRINSGEYKLMGLAPYGNPTFYEALRENVLYLADDGSFSLNPEYFSYFHGLRTYSPQLVKLMGKPPRDPGDRVSQHYADVAASVQRLTDEAMGGLARRARDETGLPNLVMAGGVCLNVVSTSYVEKCGIFDHVWVQPAAGDAGGSLGAALWAYHNLLARGSETPTGTDNMQGCFLGPEPGTSEDIAGLLTSRGLEGTELGEGALAEAIARLVAEGKTVAVARGRMEFGPRALGNRSILADARDGNVLSLLNSQVKKREGFRPFAPIVLSERAAEWFDIGERDSPFMLKVYPVAQHLRSSAEGRGDIYQRATEVRSSIPAVTHVDFSARVQTVDKERNPFLHTVLSCFERDTGCPVMVNTSFNVRGEPVVCTAEDALNGFLATEVDALVLGNYLLIRAEQSEAILQYTPPQWDPD